jgi:hypothetical protein
MAGVTPARGLRLIGLGSAVIALVALLLLALLKLALSGMYS